MAETVPPNAPRTDYPMGCGRCLKEPATHLQVYRRAGEYGGGWSEFFLGENCIHKNGPSPAAWTFRLVPDNGGGCNG